MVDELSDEQLVRARHTTRDDFRNIMGDLLCIECEDVHPCAEIRALDALHELLSSLEKVAPGDWEAFRAGDGELALRPTIEAAYAGAQRHIASLQAELGGYEDTQRTLQDAQMSAADDADKLRKILRTMVSESVVADNAGLTPDDPDWKTVDTFFEQLIAWTPTVSSVLLAQIATALTEPETPPQASTT